MGGVIIDDDDWELASPTASEEVRNIVLVGCTGNGKSATGNTILQRAAFDSMFSLDGVTKTCELQSTKLNDGMILNVIDTPGLFDFSNENECIGDEIVNCLNIIKDGIHAILVVLSIRNRFSREEEAVVKCLREIFGSSISDYMIIVFTGADYLEESNTTLESYLSRNCPEPLKEILRMCGNRRILFDNKTENESKKKKQLEQLLTLVKTVIDENGGKPYTNDLFLKLKERAMKVCDETVEVNSAKGCSKDEMYKLKEEILEKVELKLKETTSWLKLQLAEEKLARLKAEANAREAQMKSEEEIRHLRESLAKAERETEELRKQKSESEGRCTIL